MRARIMSGSILKPMVFKRINVIGTPWNEFQTNKSFDSCGVVQMDGVRPPLAYPQHRWTRVWLPCWRWSPAPCSRWQSCGTAFCRGRVSEGSLQRSPPGGASVSAHSGSPLRCSRWRCRLCGGASCTTRWMSATRQRQLSIQKWSRARLAGDGRGGANR